MKVTNLWENIFKYSDYEKGAEYSASDIIGDVLRVKLRKMNPLHDDMAYEDKIASFMGSAIHQRAEDWLAKENAFEPTGIRSEVKLKFKNISGTADLILEDGTIVDYKTGKEPSVRKHILDYEKGRDSSWLKQLSIYAYLNHKQNKVPYGEVGYIAWLCTSSTKEEEDEHASYKHGILEVKLMSKEDVVAMIKKFLVDIEQDPKDMDACEECIYWKYRWCGVRKLCPAWDEAKNSSNVEEW